MPILLFFNELSSAIPRSRRQIDQAMVAFVELMRTIRKLRSDTALVTALPVKSMELAPGYTVQQWINTDGANRDRWLLIRAIQNRAPYRAALPDGAATEVEYWHNGRRAEGIGGAHLSGGLAVSLLVDIIWDGTWITATRELLVEDEHENDALRQETVQVRHAATPDHAADYKIWVQEAGQEDLTSGVAIWERRSHFFPHLTFLPRAEEDLRNLRLDWIRPVAHVLIKLEHAVADWNAGQDALPVWGTKVTQEFEQRERLCRFVDLDGVERIFEWHARFTPGAGRLHFRLVVEDRTARVAYIGLKRGI